MCVYSPCVHEGTELSFVIKQAVAEISAPKPPMTPTDLRAALADLHWSQRGLAAILRKDERQVRRWATGEAQIPPAVADWLARLAEAMRANPPPR